MSARRAFAPNWPVRAGWTLLALYVVYAAGRLDFDAALRWEATDQMLRLTQVHVRGFSLVAGAAPRTATELQRRGVAPGAITAQERAVEIRFVPSVR